MRLYEWPSTMLKNYGRGHIFVCAGSVDEARVRAWSGLEAYLYDRYDYLFQDGQPRDEDDAAILDGYRRAFDADIAADPTVHDGPVFVAGSE